MESHTEQPKKIGRIRRGWLATKGSWAVFRINKRLVIFSLIGFMLGWALLIAGVFTGLWASGGHFIDTDPAKHHGPGVASWAIWIATGILVYVVSTLASGAIVACSLKAFRGEKSSLSYGFGAIKRRFGSLLAYALFSGTVAQILGFLENRLPFAGRLITYITNVLWSAATLFAVPIIMDNDKPIMPLPAIKKSTDIIRHIWGEAISGQVSLAIIFVPILILEILIFPFVIMLSTFAMIGHAPGPAYQIGVPIAIDSLLLVATLVVLNVLSSILSAALYFFATTGKAPEQFNREMLHQAFTRRKARKLFARI